MRRLLMVLLGLCGIAVAQQNIINVPSADIVDKGTVYSQAQSNYQPSPAYFTHSQSLAVGLGHDFEIDMDGYNFTRRSTATYGPGFKWAPYHQMGITAFLGDLTWFPGNGNLFYAGAAVQEGKARFTGGIWNSQQYFQSGNHTGAMLGVEYQIRRFTPQCDWNSGTAGYAACAVAMQFGRRLMIGPGYQWGNTRVTQGNHSALVQVGVTF